MEEGERKEFISRIGTFFLLIGVGTMWVFIVSDMSNNTDFVFFFVSIVSLVSGWHFKRITAAPRKTGSRFEALRKFIQKRREDKAKRAEASKKK